MISVNNGPSYKGQQWPLPKEFCPKSVSAIVRLWTDIFITIRAEPHLPPIAKEFPGIMCICIFGV